MVSRQKKFAFQTVTLADDLSKGSDTDGEYNFEDENNNELEDSESEISEPDYDVTADPVAKAQWKWDIF